MDRHDGPRGVGEVVHFGRYTEDLYDANRLRRALRVSGQLLPRKKKLHPWAVDFHLSQHWSDAERFEDLVPIVWHSNG